MGICWECIDTFEMSLLVFTYILFGAMCAGFIVLVATLSGMSEKMVGIVSIGGGVLLTGVFLLLYLAKWYSYPALFYKTNEVLQIVAHLPDDVTQCVGISVPNLDLNKNIFLIKKADFNNVLEKCEVKHGEDRLKQILNKE